MTVERSSPDLAPIVNSISTGMGGNPTIAENTRISSEKPVVRTRNLSSFLPRSLRMNWTKFLPGFVRISVASISVSSTSHAATLSRLVGRLGGRGVLRDLPSLPDQVGADILGIP